MTSTPDLQIVSVIGANGQPLPIHGNSIGSTWTDHVKQERADEAEIRELAAKMLEKQKDIMAKQQQQAAQIATRQANGAMHAPLPPGANGQTNILNFMSRQQKVQQNGTATNGRSGAATPNGDSSSTDDKKAPCDEESQKGHFGWTTIAKTHIPFIYRQQEKYCSVRMIENKLLNKFLNALHSDIYSCTHVRSYYITDAEARLFLEINNKHCDGEFGRENFTPKDLVVRLSDANKFHQFLDICYRKLVSGSKSPSEKCGFIRINKESVVPYTVRNNEQVVPLFYFEGETENLKQKADYLSGWDLAYLKFCCKVQGIRNELFSSENVAVISLTDIKSYFPNGTEFEDYWPSKVVDSNLLIGNRATVNNSVNWTRQPAHPPPKVISQPNINQKSAHSMATQQQHQMLKRNASAGNAYAQTAAAAVVAAMQQPNGGQRMHSNNALAQATVQALTNGSWMSPAPNNLQMFHNQMLQAQQAQQQAAAAQNSRAQYRNTMESLMMSNRQPYSAYNNAAISMQAVSSHGQGNAPPPLVRSANGQAQNHMSNIEQALLQQRTQQQQRHASNSIQLRPPCPGYPITANTAQDGTTSCVTQNSNLSNKTPNISLADLSSLESASRSWLNNFNASAAAADPTSTASAGARVPAAAAAAAAAPMQPSSPLPAPPPPNALFDYANLAFWNQMTPQQRLMLTQQVKSGQLNVAKNSFLSGLPSLPIDTEVTTVFDYNKTNARTTKTPVPSHASANHSNVSGGAFTKPTNVPPAMHENANYNRDVAMRSPPHASAVSLNSSTALEDFEKRFKMTEEMKAVVQKVLSNPDLSTFIQTNSSNSFMPFISPPVSPAISSANALSVLPSTSVTITPQLPSSNVGHSPSGTAAGNGGLRHKSVIVPPSPSASSYSNSTPSPSPTRLANISITPSPGTSHTHKSSTTFHSNRSQQQQLQQKNNYQLNSNSSPLEVIDLSSPRRSLQASSNYMQQQQQHQVALAAAAAHTAAQQRMAAASQQNGRSISGSSALNAASAAHSASHHLQRHAAMAAVHNADAAAQRLHVIPEHPHNNPQSPPYKIQKVCLENNMVPCINMKAYDDTQQLMTLNDFQKYFFPTISLDHCKRLIEALNLELFKGNRKQTQVLMEHDRNHNENIPLVQVRDVMRYMTQLTFMIRNQEQPPNKRSRVS